MAHRADEYGGLLGHDLEAEGLPSKADFAAHYREQADFDAALTPFNQAFVLYRFVVIFVGISDGARSGTASDLDADARSLLRNPGEGTGGGPAAFMMRAQEHDARPGATLGERHGAAFPAKRIPASPRASRAVPCAIRERLHNSVGRSRLLPSNGKAGIPA